MNFTRRRAIDETEPKRRLPERRNDEVNGSQRGEQGNDVTQNDPPL